MYTALIYLSIDLISENGRSNLQQHVGEMFWPSHFGQSSNISTQQSLTIWPMKTLKIDFNKGTTFILEAWKHFGNHKTSKP